MMTLYDNDTKLVEIDYREHICSQHHSDTLTLSYCQHWSVHSITTQQWTQKFLAVLTLYGKQNKTSLGEDSTASAIDGYSFRNTSS